MTKGNSWGEEKSIKNIILELEEFRLTSLEEDRQPSRLELDFFNKDREGSLVSVMYMPHERSYSVILNKLDKNDILCDMGAGDLRFPLLAIEKCKKVYAIEMNPEILSNALKILGYNIPRNLIVTCGDWRFVPVPNEVTVITCMVNGAKINLKEWCKKGRRILLDIDPLGDIDDIRC